AIVTFENINEASSNVSVYWILYKYSHADRKEGYYAKFMSWKKAESKIKQNEVTNNLMEQQYFMAFLAISNYLHENAEQNIIYYLPPSDRMSESTEPFIEIEEKMYISSKFLEQGCRYFVEMKYRSEKNYDGKRAALNSTAERNTAKLISFLLDMELSPLLKEVVYTYKGAFTSYTIPSR
ncbi:MAG: hypothetical protein J7497_05900, partial [Chitinophagaceae bacterium]|nr:hypothetical protein [Chitinophagaceae bacterium]